MKWVYQYFKDDIDERYAHLVGKNAILREFGSVRALRKASPQDIARRVPGIGPELAEEIVKYLAAHKPDGSGDIL